MKKYYTIGTVIIMGFVLSGCASVFSPKNDLAEQNARAAEEKDAMTEQFVQAQVQEGILHEDEVRRLITASEEAALLDVSRAPELLKEHTYGEKLVMIGTFVKKMMADTGRTRISQRDSVLTDTEIPMVDLITGAKKYYYGEDGEQRYQDYLAQRFGIGVYPTIDELNGTWHGEMTVTKVMIFHELGTAPIGYDEAKINALEGEKDAISFTLAAKSADTGTLTPVAGENVSSMPFVYDFIPKFTDKITSASFTYHDVKEKGQMNVAFGRGQINGTMLLHATKGDGGALSGTTSIDLFNGYIKISGEITAKKQ
ncbi:MAG: hypothetical protein WC819_00975 [Parcubacteria group bacterium]|jgi:uncharacterized ParB-like nuclease family protein